MIGQTQSSDAKAHLRESSGIDSEDGVRHLCRGRRIGTQNGKAEFNQFCH
jgi:hypothetical protein